MLLSMLPDSPVLSCFEKLTPHSFSCFQMILWNFGRIGISILGISSCYGIIHSTVFPFSIYLLFSSPLSFFLFFFLIHAMSFHFPTLITGFEAEFDFDFKELPFSLPPYTTALPKLHVNCPVIPCAKAPYLLRIECYRCSKRAFI